MLATSKLCIAIGVLLTLASVVPAIGADKPPADLMSLVPADAWAVVVVNNMSDLSAKIDAYAKQIGLDPVGAQAQLLRKLGLGTGVSTKRPGAVVVMNRQLYGQDNLAVLLAVKDFDIVAKTLEAKATESPGVMEGRNEELDTCFLARKAGYVIISPSQGVVQAILMSKRAIAKPAGAKSAALAADSDVFVHANLPPMVEQIKPILMGAAMMGAMGAMSGMPAPAAGTPTPGESPGAVSPQMAQMQAMQNMGKIMTVLIELLDQFSSFQMGITLEPSQAKGAFLLGFKPGSELASIIAVQKPTAQSLLKGLPGPDATLAFGYRWVPKLAKFHNALFEMTPPFANPADRAKYIRTAKEMATMQPGAAVQVRVNTPSAAMPGRPQGLLAVQGFYHVTDAKKYMELMKTVIDLQAKASIPQATTQPAGSVKMPVKYERGVQTIAGLSVDRYSVDVTSMMNMPGMEDVKRQITGLFAMLFGQPDGLLSVRMAAAGEKMIVMDMTNDDAAMATLIKAAKSGSLALAGNAKVAKATGAMSKKKLAECYVDIGKIISSVMMVQQQMAMMSMMAGGRAPATAPAMPKINTPLIAMAKTIEDGAVKVELVVPVEVVKQLVVLGKTMSGGMMKKPPRSARPGGIK